MVTSSEEPDTLGYVESVLTEWHELFDASELRMKVSCVELTALDLLRYPHAGAGRAAFDQSPVAPKLLFRAQAEDGGAAALRLKVEINTREIEAYDRPLSVRHAVNNPWFIGEADISTYSPEEMLATKL